MTQSTPKWQPPSESLVWADGVWRAPTIESVSYPTGIENAFNEIEDRSYWFRHRINAFRSVLPAKPVDGPVLDIGGGNGQIALKLQEWGWDPILLEPGSGALNGLNRGVKKIIQAALDDADLAPHSLAAACAFDVIEHIDKDVDFLRLVHSKLRPGHLFYCTVPAYPWLWSHEDHLAGHYRRYTPRSLRKSVEAAGFQVEHCSHFFSWLTAPVFLARTVPFLLKFRPKDEDSSHSAIKSDHELPSWASGVVERIHRWEIRRLKERMTIPFGTSLLCVARSQEQKS